MVSIEFKEACAQINEILAILDKKEVDKIPEETRQIFNINQSKDYNSHIDSRKTLDKQELKKETKDILVYLYVNYWCSDKEKQEVNKILNENYEKKQLELKGKYNTDNIFKKNQNKSEYQDKMLKEYKENMLNRIYNFIKKELKIFLDN